jgi:hypothetical protein
VLTDFEALVPAIQSGQLSHRGGRPMGSALRTRPSPEASPAVVENPRRNAPHQPQLSKVSAYQNLAVHNQVILQH